MPSTATSILDGLSASVAVKAPCRTATTANITLSGLQTIDGVTLIENDRVLVKDQTTQSENGIYLASTGSWTRAKDFDGSRDARQGTLVLVANSGTNIYYRVSSANPIVIGTSSIAFELVSGAVTQSIIGAALYPRTAAEISVGVTPTNYFHPPGHVYRYGTNTTPGTTDMTSAINTCADVCREGNYVLQLPPETCLVSSTLDFSSIRVVGSVPHGVANDNIQASSAQFNVITTTGNSVFEDFSVHGGWDGVTAGQSGDTFYLVDAVNGFCYNVHFYNVNINYSKRRGIYWEVSGYGSMNHVDCTVSGLHGLEIWAASAANLATTVYISGQSRFSDCPNGYSVKLTECISIAFDGCIMENSSGIQLNGADNRAISFNDVYQENSGGGGTFLDGTGSSGFGLTITNCYGASKDVTGLTSWENVFFSGNSALTLPPIPLAARVTLTDGGQLTTSTTGGVNVTATSVSLAPGTYLMWGTVQTLAGSGSNLLQSGCALTGDSGGAGLNNATSVADFRPGVDIQTYNPGGGMDHRLSCFNVVQITSTTTMYLRAYFNFSGAGSMTYHGQITSILLS